MTHWNRLRMAFRFDPTRIPLQPWRHVADWRRPGAKLGPGWIGWFVWGVWFRVEREMNWLVKYVKICWHELLCMFHSIDVFFMFPMTFLNEKMDLSKNSWSAIHTGLVVWNIFYFSIYWEESSHLTNIFQYGWNHQPVIYYPWMHLGSWD